MKKITGILLLSSLSFFSAKADDTTCVAGAPVDFFVTNVITPNGDGRNDVFSVNSKNLIDLHVEIYDRWGLKVYMYDGVNGLWDGTSFGVALGSGVYYYVVKYNTTCSNTPAETSGFIQIFREL